MERLLHENTKLGTSRNYIRFSTALVDLCEALVDAPKQQGTKRAHSAHHALLLGQFSEIFIQSWDHQSCSIEMQIRADISNRIPTPLNKFFETRNVHITSHTAFFSSGAEWTTALTKVYPEPGSQHASLILVHPFWVSNCHELILRAVGFLCIANSTSFGIQGHVWHNLETFRQTSPCKNQHWRKHSRRMMLDSASRSPRPRWRRFSSLNRLNFPRFVCQIYTDL